MSTSPDLVGDSMNDEDEVMEPEDDEKELEKEGSDLDFVRERLQDESGGMDAYSQALESIQDPKLKEIIQAIQEDEQKHQAALEQWLQENGGGAEEEDAANVARNMSSLREEPVEDRRSRPMRRRRRGLHGGRRRRCHRGRGLKANQKLKTISTKTRI